MHIIVGLLGGLAALITAIATLVNARNNKKAERERGAD
jgi:hypothetical protein